MGVEAPSRFGSFSSLRATSLLLRQLWWGGVEVGTLHFVVVILALWVLLRPTSVERFAALLAAEVLSVGRDMPAVHSHTLLVMVCAASVLAYLAVEALYTAFLPAGAAPRRLGEWRAKAYALPVLVGGWVGGCAGRARGLRRRAGEGVDRDRAARQGREVPRRSGIRTTGLLRPGSGAPRPDVEDDEPPRVDLPLTRAALRCAPGAGRPRGRCAARGAGSPARQGRRRTPRRRRSRTPP